MTAITTAEEGARRSEREGASILETRWAAFCIGLALAMALSWPMAHAIWSQGPFVDTDDAMRMVQVRDWLAGQGWYDLTAHRMDPPFGVFMHWSRVVDVPIAILLKAFGLFVSPERSERLARLVYSFGWLAAFVYAACWTAEALEGPAAWLPTAILTGLSGLTFSAFQPGRIDHDSAQITLFAFALGAMLRGLQPERWRWAGLSAAFAAVALAIGLEELPLFIVLFVAPALAWIARGDELRRALAIFGVSLATSLSLMYAATVGPARWTFVACDALSSFHLVGLGLGAASCLLFAGLSRRLRTPFGRSVCATLAGAATIAVAWTLFPACFGSPFAQVDPLVRRYWLDTVNEARPLASVIAENPALAPMLICPLLFTIAASSEGALHSRGLARERWLLVAGLTIAGGALSLWQSRGLVCTAPLGLLAGARAATLAARAARRWPAGARTGAKCLAILPFSALPYAAAPALLPQSAQSRFVAQGMACLAPRSFAGIAALPPGRVIAPINAGAHLLAYTRDSVFGAPYHRDNRGNRLVLEAFRSAPDAMRQEIEAAGARYVMVCPGLDGAEVAGSLGAALEAEHPPTWLSQVRVAHTPFKVYEVTRNAP